MFLFCFCLKTYKTKNNKIIPDFLSIYWLLKKPKIIIQRHVYNLNAQMNCIKMYACVYNYIYMYISTNISEYILCINFIYLSN